MGSQDAGDELGTNRCPYCLSGNECVHLLLCVDKTFRTAEGGLLMSAFNERWSQIEEASEDPNFDERASFQTLLEKVDSLANMSADWDFEGGPGRSSAYELFYSKSEAHAQDALERFIAAAQ